ncbi:MAG TPA: hypothetical protein VKV73_06945 [Chloroflexota bacterium]|nr:hypothetical protein [Chloroflexota bacterium]
MKLRAVLAATLVLLLAAAQGGPISRAQDDPGSGAVSQDIPPCPQAPDMESDDAATGDAAPTCTPTDVPPEAAAPTDTPTPVPSDTPVQTDTPIPTDTPPPAAPTDTPTPLPPVATDTPTPTSGSRDVPVGTLSRQLPFANPGEDECDIDLTVTDNQPCNSMTFPAMFKIVFSPFPTDASMTVQVDGGKTQKASLDKLNRWDFLSLPGGQIGAGTHTMTFTETSNSLGAFTASVNVTIRPANSPHLLVYPRNVKAGSSAKIYLAGYAANTTFPLGMYRERQNCNAFGQGNECYELVRDLGTIKTGGDGTAIQDFSVGANEAQTTYLIGTSGLKIDPKNVAESLKTFGRPWFVVPQS